MGPFDLSLSMGIRQQYDHPDFRDALTKVAGAARAAGKAAGILLNAPEQVGRTIADGFTFIGLGSDGGVVAEGMTGLAAAIRERT